MAVLSTATYRAVHQADRVFSQGCCEQRRLQRSRVFLQDFDYESLYKHESGDTAIDEGYFTGTNSAPLQLPSGETLPATEKSIRIRGCDIATVENGLIREHRLYYDRMEFLGQLGLLPEGPSPGA